MTTMVEAVRVVNSATAGTPVTVVTGVGSHQQVVAREFSLDNPRRRLLTSAGHGTVGFGLPAALGAAVSEPDRWVVLFDGDGSAAMDLIHFHTAVDWGVKRLIVIVVDNGSAGIVQQFEDLRGYRHAATVRRNPDFVAVGRAYGWAAQFCPSVSHLKAYVLGALVHPPGPYLFHVPVEDYAVWPILEGGKWLDDMTDAPRDVNNER